MFAALFALLYVAHLLADYPAQTDHQAAHKADPGAPGWRADLVHAATHLLASVLALLVGAAVVPEVRVSVGGAALGVVWVAGSHAFIDRRWPVRWWMEHARQRGFMAHGGAAHVDQTAHVLALTVAALLMSALG